MRIEVLVCDNCKSTKNVEKDYTPIRAVDLCENCKKKLEGLKIEFDTDYEFLRKKWYEKAKATLPKIFNDEVR